ncbi:MAG: deoxyhypusine synthase [bacterium]|nr:deoxyhypusine synthase [bacterium]
MNKQDLLKTKVEHISLDTFNPVPLVDAMEKMAFQARNTARAARIYEMMLQDKDCAVVLCLAGSLISAGLKRVILQLLENDMVDAIVSTGANIVDQDFFEGLGFHHWQGTPFIDDNDLRDLAIDRIYDTYIDEDELRICDDTCKQIADSLDPRPYSSREFIAAMGKHLKQNGKNPESIVQRAYEKSVPIFCPAFSDCSAGFGLVEHQYKNGLVGKPILSIDSAKDFLELTRIKMAASDTGLFMIGGGVPKNFAQDIVVAADILGEEAAMHKYAIQITVADERDGALSGSTLKEASSWGKVSTSFEQMVYGEATVVFPLIAGYCYHKQSAKGRSEKRYSDMLDQPVPSAD